MISKLVKGARFDGLLRYLASKPGATVLDSSPDLMLDCDALWSETQRSDAAARLQQVAALSSRVRKPVLHVSLALPQAEPLEPERWRSLARDYLAGMGLAGCSFVAFQHHDTQHPHIHLVVCRVHPTRKKVVSDSWDFFRSARVCRDLERRYALTPVPNPWDTPRSQLHTGEVRSWRRTGLIPRRLRLRSILAHEFRLAHSLESGLQRVRERGVQVRFRRQDDQVVGVSFALEGVPFQGRRLGQSFSWTQILSGFARRRQQQGDLDFFLDQLALLLRHAGGAISGRSFSLRLALDGALSISHYASGQLLLHMRHVDGRWHGRSRLSQQALRQIQAVLDLVRVRDRSSGQQLNPWTQDLQR